MKLRDERETLANDFRTSRLHDVETVRIQTGKTKQLSNSLQKHHNHWECHPAYSFLHTPPIDNHASWNNAAKEENTAAQSIFRLSVTSLGDVLLNHMICITAAEEGAEKIAAARGDVE
jgi:hypothetical protein